MHTVGYRLRPLVEPKKKLVTTEKGFPTVVLAIPLLRRYLEWSRFTDERDYEALKLLLTMTNANGKLVRCRLRLFDCDLDIIYHSSANHQPADIFFCMRSCEGDIKELESKIPVMTVFDQEHS